MDPSFFSMNSPFDLHTDIDVLFTWNQYLRWVVVDELPMVPEDLPGAFGSHLADAASPSRYQRKA